MVRDIQDHLHFKEFVIGINLDIKEAFDSVDRTNLLENLNFYGNCDSALNWFYSYLTTRFQYVMFKIFPSNTTRVDFGTPQGVGISPILFFFFINDIEDCSNNAGCVLYTDDTSLYVISPNWQDVFHNASTVIADYSRWLQYK